MTKPSALGFVFPSAVLGGHESMACAWIERLVHEGCDVVCYGPPENHRLVDRLARLSISLRPLPVRSARLESIRALVDRDYVNRAAAFLARAATNGGKLVVVQGDIETGSVFLVAARRAGIPLVSYLPYCHSFTTMRKPLGWVRDLVNRWVYRCCHDYWTITPAFARQLKRLSPRATVTVYQNFLPQPPRFVTAVSRPPHEVHVVVVGRVYFPHKGQDLFLRALRRLKVPEGRLLVAHLVGDGPDLARAQTLARRAPAGVQVEFHGWLEGWWNSFSARDVLVIPSRFEGVPLVLLEAQSLGMRVLVTNRNLGQKFQDLFLDKSQW